MFQQSFKVYKDILWDRPQDSRTAFSQGRLLRSLGNVVEGDLLIDRAIELRKQLVPNDHRLEERLVDRDFDILVYYFYRWSIVPNADESRACHLFTQLPCMLLPSFERENTSKKEVGAITSRLLISGMKCMSFPRRTEVISFPQYKLMSGLRTWLSASTDIFVRITGFYANDTDCV